MVSSLPPSPSLSCSLSSSQKGNWWTPRWPLTLRGQHPQNSQMSEFRATAQGLRFRAYPCGARPLLCSVHTTQIPLHTCYSASRLGISAAYQSENLQNEQKTSQKSWLIIVGSINVWIFFFWCLLVCSFCFLCCIFSNDSFFICIQWMEF